jgi:hypothetical protein
MVAHLRPALCAAVLAFSGSAFAGGPVHHRPPPHGVSLQAPKLHRPQTPIRSAPAAAQQGAVAPLPPAPAPVTPPLQSLPYWFGGYPYPATVVVAAPPPPAPRLVQPLSFHLADPSAVAIRLPSGRIAVRGVGGYRQRGHSMARPYAPPTIQIIGKASGQHMRGPVHLVHGVQPPKRLATSPQVIWLKQPAGGRGPLKSVE